MKSKDLLLLFNKPIDFMKVIPVSAPKIDSINVKIDQINQSISSLQKKQVVLQDSIIYLNKALEKSEIKTSFFSDQLSFQLFWFSLILGLIGLISWKSLITPLSKKIDDLITDMLDVKNSFIPDQINKLQENVDQKIQSLDNDLFDVEEKIDSTNLLTLNAVAQLHLIGSNWLFYFLYRLKIVNHHFDMDDYEDEEVEPKIIKILKDLHSVAIGEKLNIEKMKPVNVEVISILGRILKEDCHHEIKTITQKIIDLINVVEPNPETSFDAYINDNSSPKSKPAT